MLECVPDALIIDKNSRQKILEAFGRGSRMRVTTSQLHELCAKLKEAVFLEVSDHYIWDLEIN